MARSTINFLKEYLNKEIPTDEYIFRRVPLELFRQSQPEHRLEIDKRFFRNEHGDGMSLDWERICSDPVIIQTRDNKLAENFGVVVLSYFDIKRDLHEGTLKIINDQINYDCHCLAKGIPMSLKSLKKKKKEIFEKLSKEQQEKIKSVLMSIRECLKDNAFWVIPFNTPTLGNPPPNFNYFESFTDKIKEFFRTRGYSIPS